MSQTPGSNDAFNDSLSFVKKLWGGMHVPGMATPSASAMPGMQTLQGMAMPSMSLEDLDKRIQDLKTVETWLNVNMTMLRSTIQALEVQRATIATLHSLSSSMADTMKGMSAGAANNPFSSYMAHSTVDAKVDDLAQTVEKPASVESTAPTHSDSATTEHANDASPLISQSAAWWSGVQEQFKHALGTALEKSAANYEAVKSVGETVAKAAVAKPKAGTIPATKPSSKAISKTAPKPVSKPTVKSGSAIGLKAKSVAKSVAKSPAKTVSKSPAKSVAASRKAVK